MASLATSSSYAQEQWRYDVFLSFRGKDTRNNFTGHLYKELCQKGVITFMDDRELRKGEPIPRQLPEAIQDSKILVVILSKNYATSMWCLNELAKILECKRAQKHIVLPIFYDVSPSEVRKQAPKFREHLIQYEFDRLFKDNNQKIQRWRVALAEVANLSGWHLNHRDESEFIQDIVEHILSRLRRSSLNIANDFVGLENALEKMNEYLDLEQLNTIRIIGICGMGGIGKTTIASVIYTDFYCQFQGGCFLQNVRESSEKYGIASLQQQFLSATLDKEIKVYDIYRGMGEIKNRLRHKKILAVLDDVDQLEQLEFLIGKRGENWFGIGSRIIVTTRDEHVLKQHGVDEIYRVEELNHDHALKLFCSKACNNSCQEEYLELCYEFVKYAIGLPLALNVLGSSLCGKSLREWKSTLASIKEIPNERILSKLKLSYDGLDQISKNVFLDIACFFKGMEKDYMLNVLESCGLFPDKAMGDLIDKSLIRVSQYVWMHDLIQEMGKEIVRRESCEDPGLRSRIWLDKDVYRIQLKGMETKQVKAIVLHSWEQAEEHLSAKIFSKVKELRLLILRNVPTSPDIEYLSNEIRYLEWYESPLKSLPSSFQPDKLVQLHMPSSNIEQLWKRVKKPLKLLKIINLSHSKRLIKTPDFRDVPNLEELNLEGCESLREVHQSIGVLKRLVHLNLKNCRNLATLPNSIRNLNSLKIFILHNCSKLMKLPDRLGDMTSLEKFDAAGIGNQRPKLVNQRNLYLLSWLMPWTWKNLHPIAIAFPSLSALPFLKELQLSYCNLLEEAIPGDLTGFPLLEYLDLSGNKFLTLPSTISHLSQLRSLRLSNCKKLRSLPVLPSNIQGLYVDYCTSLERLPNLSDRHNMKDFEMDFSNCFKLKNNDQRNVIVAFTWLKSFLFSFLKIRLLLRIKEMCTSKDQFEKICHKENIDAHRVDCCPLFALHFPRNEIPEWFTNQSSKSPLKIHLASCEKWWNIAGFVVCILIPGQVLCPETKCEVTMYSKENVILMKKRVTEVRVNFYHDEIKKCGIRIVHEKEIQQLMELDEPLENLGPFQNFEEIYSSDSGEEAASRDGICTGWNPSGHRKRKMMQSSESDAQREDEDYSD